MAYCGVVARTRRSETKINRRYKRMYSENGRKERAHNGGVLVGGEAVQQRPLKGMRASGKEEVMRNGDLHVRAHDQINRTPRVGGQ